jgi:hypothetical protein
MFFRKIAFPATARDLSSKPKSLTECEVCNGLGTARQPESQ